MPAGVMHDVNNALNPIMAAAYLLEANAENPAAVRDYAVRIAKAAETGAATAARVGRFIRQVVARHGAEDVAIDPEFSIGDGSAGTLSAGPGPARLDIGGNLILTANAISIFDLSNPDLVGEDSKDLVNVGGDLTLGGTLQIAQGAVSGYHRLFEYGGTLSGSFAKGTPRAVSWMATLGKSTSKGRVSRVARVERFNRVVFALGISGISSMLD